MRRSNNAVHIVGALFVGALSFTVAMGMLSPLTARYIGAVDGWQDWGSSSSNNCGNNVREGTEQCDGGDHGGQTCGSWGFAGGTMSCNMYCQIETVGCTHSVCGNGQVEEGETCDRTNVNGQTCVSLGLGFTGGSLGCAGDCLSYNTASCVVSSSSSISSSSRPASSSSRPASSSSLSASSSSRPASSSSRAASSSSRPGSSSSRPSVCGNSILEGAEQCERVSGVFGACCNPSTCMFRSNATICRAASGGGCDVSDYCSGTSATCGNSFQPAGTICRAAAGICDIAETCNGSSDSCPATNRFAGSTTICRPAAGQCDRAEFCSGGAATCPSTDAKNPAGTACTITAGTTAALIAATSVCDGRNNNCPPLPTCGNGVINMGEQCDPGTSPSVPANMSSWTCYTMGVHPDYRTDCDPVTGFCRNNLNFTGGNLRCTSSCRLDLSQCNGCGNARIESGESCDTTNLNGQTCESQGFAPNGVLSCNKDNTCRYFDTSRCVPLNECRQLDSSCGDGDTRPCCGGLYCSNQRNVFGARICKPLCGNRIIDRASGEECEPSIPIGQVCSNLGRGYDNGALSCDSATCRFNVSDCSTCGNSTREGPEQCDGSVPEGAVCTNVPGENFDGGGDLSCNNNTCRFNTANCSRCGNGRREALEQCDGADRGGEECTTLGLGYDNGTLGCNNFCQYNTSQCSICGNGETEGPEQCDVSVPPGATCLNVPDGDFSGGTLNCNNATCRFRTDQCTTCDALGSTCCAFGASRYCMGDVGGVTLSCNTITERCEKCAIENGLCCGGNSGCGNNPNLTCVPATVVEPARCRACGANTQTCCNTPGIAACNNPASACHPTQNTCQTCGNAAGSPCCGTAPNLSCTAAPGLTCNTTTRLCEACGTNGIACCRAPNPAQQCTEGACVGGDVNGIGGTCQVCGGEHGPCCTVGPACTNAASDQNPTGLLCDGGVPPTCIRRQPAPAICGYVDRPRWAMQPPFLSAIPQNQWPPFDQNAFGNIGGTAPGGRVSTVAGAAMGYCEGFGNPGTDIRGKKCESCRSVNSWCKCTLPAPVIGATVIEKATAYWCSTAKAAAVVQGQIAARAACQVDLSYFNCQTTDRWFYSWPRSLFTTCEGTATCHYSCTIPQP